MNQRYSGIHYLEEAQFEVCRLMAEKGFANNVREDTGLLWQTLTLIHTEVSEAAQCVKHGELEAENLGTELADAFIRILFLMGSLGFDVQALFNDKMNKNALRPHRYNINPATTK